MPSHARTSLDENMDLFDPASVAAAQAFIRVSETLISPFLAVAHPGRRRSLPLASRSFCRGRRSNPLFVAAVERATLALAEVNYGEAQLKFVCRRT